MGAFWCQLSAGPSAAGTRRAPCMPPVALMTRLQGDFSAEQRGPSRLPKNSRVLVVEDDSRLRKLMSDVLTLSGWEVTEAGDAAAMRRHMSARAQEVYPDEPFDLIITDVQMPGENGLAALEWFRRRGCPTPALVVTSFPELATKQRVQHLHAALLSKPFSLAEFREAASAVRRGLARVPRG